MTNLTARADVAPDVLAAAAADMRAMAGPVFAALERSGMSVLVTDPQLPDNPIIAANAAFQQLTGYSEAELLGRNCRFLQGAQTDVATLARLSRAIRAGEPVEAELLNYRKDGTAFWNALFISPIQDPAGRTAFMMSTQHDVTAMREARAVAASLAAEQRHLDGLNQRLRVAMSNSGAAAWEWHVGTGRIVGDDRFAALYGLDGEQASAGIDPTRFFAIIHPADRNRIRLGVGAMLRGAEVFSKEFRIQGRDGAVRWVQARGRSLLDENGEPVRFTGAMVDITEQKRVEERLRIAQTAGGIGTFEYIHGFATVSVSAQFCRLLGLHDARDLPVRTINAIVHPADAPIIDLAIRPEAGLASQTEFRIRRPDNGEVRWLMRRGEYLRDAETAGLRFSGVIYDITQAKHVERQLRTLNETLEARVEERTRERDRIWQVSRDVYMLCASDGTCKSANPAWQTELGYDAEIMRESRLVQFIHPDDRAAMEAMIAGMAHGDYVENFDARVLCGNNQVRAYSWTCAAEDHAFFAVGRDVTQRNELEERLRQSQKMEAVGQLTGGIAHDFNNLLTGIAGALDMVRRRLAQGRLDNVERFMDAAMTSAQRAAALTHRLLAFSRRQSLDIRALDINALVASMEDLLHRTLGEQIELVVDLGTGLWAGHSDANQLESALLNLAINSRDAMPQGGRLSIATSNIGVPPDRARQHQDLVPGDYVVIAVRDTGTGMTPDVLAKAFDPFFTTKPIGQGTGLGLSMIYGFARQSGGHVHIESTPGRGTTICLYVPRFTGSRFADQEFTGSGELRGTPDTGSPAPLPGAEGETVLVVEDDPAVRLLVLEVLHELHYEAIEAVDSRTALPILCSPRKIDLMVSDVGLPGMNGRHLAEMARQYRPDLKVLFMTGYAASAAVRADFLLADMDMISKPFAIEALAVKIRDMLR